MENNGMILGRGRTADVYEYGADKALKLFVHGFPEEEVTREYELASLAATSGLPVPAVYGMIDADGRHGIIFERIRGVTLTRWATNNPLRLRKAGRLLAQLHYSVHCIRPDGDMVIPTQQQSLQRSLAKADLPDTVERRVPQWLDSLTAGNALCHGDFHPDNVIMTDNGPRIIDWMTAGKGSAAADAARTWIILSSPYLPPDVPMKSLVQLIRSSFCRSYLRSYLAISQTSLGEIMACRQLVAAARTAENVPGEREYLLGLMENSSEQAPRQ